MKAIVALGTILLLQIGVYGNPDWWKTMSLYQIYPRSFMDSNGDGIGDLKGIQSRLQYLVESNFDVFWLSPIYPSPMVDFGYDISNFTDIDPVYGTLEDFEDLLVAAHNLSLKVVMDFVPNHSSDKHPWFQNSIKKIDPYTDYYIWHKGKVVNGVRKPPNNWLNMFRGSAWTWNEERKAYYLHQFAAGQPDLNFHNKKLVEEMKNVLRFWMDKGVDGFRVDAIPHLFENTSFPDEPRSGYTNDSEAYPYLNHIYTRSLPETYEMVTQWRKVVDEYSTANSTRALMIEAYDEIHKIMDYYHYKAHFPFNFGFVTSVNRRSGAREFKRVIDEWTKHLPNNATSNWVAGNHDSSRLVSRFGRDMAPAVTMLVQLLPGIAVTYNGEEIGMEDTRLSWEETQDPQGCNAGKKFYERYSRDPARTPFQWDNTTSAGFSTNPKTWLRVNSNYKTINLAAQKAAAKSYYKDFLKVTKLRKWPSVRQGSLKTQAAYGNIFGFSRELKGELPVYVIINFSNSMQIIDLNPLGDVPTFVRQYYTTSTTSQENTELKGELPVYVIINFSNFMQIIDLNPLADVPTFVRQYHTTSTTSLENMCVESGEIYNCYAVQTLLARSKNNEYDCYITLYNERTRIGIFSILLLISVIFR